jgi:hypothetical protein
MKIALRAMQANKQTCRLQSKETAHSALLATLQHIPERRRKK